VIKIAIYGCSKDKRLKRRLSAAAVLFLRLLMPRKRNIDIRIKLVKDMLTKEHAHGECYDLDASEDHNYYTIRLDYGDHDVLINTLAHEMVHIKQFARRELRMLYDGYCAKWKGEKYDEECDYDLRPWEIEANAIAAEFVSKHPLI